MINEIIAIIKKYLSADFQLPQQEFNSGYSKGKKLDEKLYNIPTYNNLYGDILMVDSKTQLAEKFYQIGWSVRKASWTDYEIQCEWAELIIESDDTSPLVSGVIDPVMLQRLAQLLTDFQIRYKLELYDEKNTILEMVTSKV